MLSDLSLQVRAGEIVGVWGARGAGKTTLIHCAAGVLVPDRGEVRWFDRAARAGTRRGARVAVVTGCPPHHAFLSARQSLARTAESIADRSRVSESAEADVGALLRRAGLSRVAGRRLATLSRGALARLAVAHALLERPKLLLLDGALDALDTLGAHSRGTVTSLLRGAAADGAGCLLTARDFGVLAGIADRVVALVDGRVETVRNAAPNCRVAARVAEPSRDA